MVWIAIGIFLDIVMMATASFLLDLPGIEKSPWSSPLFIIHIGTACFGMFGFITMFVYLLIKGTNHYYGKLRKFQYKILLRLWVLGVGIALVNFFLRAFFDIRIYDHL